jgi:hypothetical protein
MTRLKAEIATGLCQVEESNYQSCLSGAKCKYTDAVRKGALGDHL